MNGEASSTLALRPRTIESIAALQARLRQGLAVAVHEASYHLMRLGPAGLSGVAATLVALFLGLATLLSINAQTSQLRRQIDSAQRYPSIQAPKEDPLGNVMAALPAREQIPGVIGQVLQQARLAGVALDSGRYAYGPPKGGVIGRYEMEFPVKAEYPKLRDFINRTLTVVPAASLDRLRLERKVVTDSVVKADVRFVVFIRSGAEK
jgi:hypothetical protein